MISCLIVDDSSVIRKCIKKLIASFDMQIEEAENGQIAFESCSKSLPDLIFLDWNMPVMDGITFLQKFRQNFSSAHTKVIFCTTENDFEKISAAITNGADEYIMKPFDEEIIKNKLIQIGIINS